MWSKGKTLEDAVVFGEEEGGLYKLKGHSETALVHENCVIGDFLTSTTRNFPM